MLVALVNVSAVCTLWLLMQRAANELAREVREQLLFIFKTKVAGMDGYLIYNYYWSHYIHLLQSFNDIIHMYIQQCLHWWYKRTPYSLCGSTM